MLASVQPLANAAGLTSLALKKEVALMKRIILMVTVALVMALMLAVAGPASGTIHPIVESVDCANPIANKNHPLGDVAEVPGQTPDYGSHSDQSSLRALSVVGLDSPAAFGHKLNGECGTPQSPM